jgi:uncharacterized protein (TIGR02147 family)
MKKSRSVFEFDSYKKILADSLTGVGRRGQLSRAAEALKCQVSFVSRVIKTEANLTTDQGFMLAMYLRLNPGEREYFQTLIEWERAGEPLYRAHLQKRLETLKRGQESLQKRTRKKDFPFAEQQAVYFSSWYWAALHFLVAIPEMQTVKSLAARLGLNESMVLDGLRRLKSYGLVSETANGHWEYASGQFHLPKDSPFVIQHHQNWRNRAVLDSQNPLNDSLHYTTVLTLSKSDAAQIKTLLLDFISATVQISAPSEPEDAMVLNCDFFSV